MNDPQGNPDDRRLERLLERTRDTVRAPHGFASRVMEAVYKESLAEGRVATGGDGQRARPRAAMSRLYGRLGWSFVLTAGVLAVSLLVPHGAYPTLIRAAGSGAALGTAPSAIVQGTLAGAGEAVQGALGQKLIGGSNE